MQRKNFKGAAFSRHYTLGIYRLCGELYQPFDITRYNNLMKIYAEIYFNVLRYISTMLLFKSNKVPGPMPNKVSSHQEILSESCQELSRKFPESFLEIAGKLLDGSIDFTRSI